MKTEMTKAELQELEQQLSCPSGVKGIEVGKMMNESNIGMTSDTIEFLDIADQDEVLELGPGNCGHLQKLLTCADELRYYALDVSETMLAEAQQLNNEQAHFKLYDGENIPYEDDFFDKVFSVNTIYFWANPGKLINEIERILKPNGTCVLTYAEKNFMGRLPFVGDRFTLYDNGDIRALVAESSLKISEFRDKTEVVKAKHGEEIERRFTMVKLRKAARYV